MPAAADPHVDREPLGQRESDEQDRERDGVRVGREAEGPDTHRVGSDGRDAQPQAEHRDPRIRATPTAYFRH
ncbi:hypothetical protein GCM10020218_072350 [Dactylosporangium vinaceum]